MEARKLKTAVIREELFALLNDSFEAIILNQLLYWSDRVSDIDKFIEEEKERNKDCNVEKQYGWIYKSANDLIDECMLKISPSTMRRYLCNLIDKGYIEERHNPSVKWDRRMQYRVNIVGIIKAIKNIGYDGLGGYKICNIHNESCIFQNEKSNIQNKKSNIQNDGAISETIIENIYKEEIYKEESQSIDPNLLPDINLDDKEEEDLFSFDRIWNLYDKKVGNKEKLKAKWAAIKKADKEKIFTHVPEYVKANPDKKYRKNFETYLNNQSWNDEIISHGNENEEQFGNLRPEDFSGRGHTRL